MDNLSIAIELLKEVQENDTKKELLDKLTEQYSADEIGYFTFHDEYTKLSRQILTDTQIVSNLKMARRLILKEYGSYK